MVTQLEIVDELIFNLHDVRCTVELGESELLVNGAS